MISAINARQIKLIFNEAVDKGSVVDSADDTLIDGLVTVTRLPGKVANDFTQTQIDDSFASLSADNKELTITIDPSETETLEGKYAIVIKKGIVSKDGTKKLEEYSNTFTAVKDTTAPTVLDTTYNSKTNEFTVKLSESVEVAPVITINGGAPITGTANDTNTEYTFANNVEQGQTANIVVSGAVDFNNNVLSNYSKSIKISREESVIQLTSLTQKESNVATVVFDKPIAVDADVLSSLTVLRNGNLMIVTSVTADSKDKTNRTFDITFDATNAPDYDIYPEGSNKTALNFTFGAEGLTDVYGNTNDVITKTITMVKDESAPSILSASLSADKESLELRFDEKVNASTNIGDITIRDKGVDVTSNFNIGAISPDGTTKVINITLDVPGEIPDGEYVVNIPAKAIQDVNGNENKAIKSPIIKVTDSGVTAETIANIADEGTTDNTFKVDFEDGSGGAVKVTDSALQLSAYSLNGVALPAGTDIYFEDADKEAVIIALPNSSVNYSSATVPLRVLNVTDINGNKVKPSQDDVTVVDNIKPTLQSASLSGNVLTLNFDEDMDAISITDLSDIVDDLEIKGGSQVLTAGTTSTVNASVDGKKVVLVIDGGDSNWDTVKLASKLTVKTIDGGDSTFADANEQNAAKAGVTVTVSK